MDFLTRKTRMRRRPSPGSSTDDIFPGNEAHETFFQRLATFLQAPLLMMLAVVMLVAVVAISVLINDFPLLAIFLGLFGVVLLWRYQQRWSSRPDWSRYQDAMQMLQKKYYAEAAELLEPLAEKSYPRAQYQLGLLLARGQGIARDIDAAAYWLQEAAARGHAGAQYELATYYMEGIGVRREPDQAMTLLQLSSKKLPEAAMSLGYYYQHHPDKEKRDLAAAAEAYALAGKLFLKKGLQDGAAAALKSLEAIAPELEPARHLRWQLSRVSRRG